MAENLQLSNDIERQYVQPKAMLSLGLCISYFFGGGGVLISRKLFDTKPGLMVTAKGITDNASGFSFGLIPWDIEDIYLINVGRQKLIMLLVHNPPNTSIAKLTPS